MLTEMYIEALLVDEDLADQVWRAWDDGLIPDELAAIAWWFVSVRLNIYELSRGVSLDFNLKNNLF